MTDQCGWQDQPQKYMYNPTFSNSSDVLQVGPQVQTYYHSSGLLQGSFLSLSCPGIHKSLPRDRERHISLGFYHMAMKFFPFQLEPLLRKFIFIFLPSWTKQINSKVGISSFITRADVLKEQNNNRSRSNLYALATS